MPSQEDVKLVGTDGSVSDLPRFDKRDFDYCAEYIIDEYHRRKNLRGDREKMWEDVDRQLRMEPNTAHKKLPNGQADLMKAWMAEMELPLQAQCLEVTTADIRRFMFAEGEPWFRANAELTDEYLDLVEGSSFVLGDLNETPSLVTQDNVNKLCSGFVLMQLRQGDFYTRADRVAAEAVKYGMGVARGRMFTKNVYIHEAMGVRRESDKIPFYQPVSIKNLYLDDWCDQPTMYSASVMGTAPIAEDHIRFENLVMAAARGSTDPNDEDGGWMPGSLAGIEKDKNGFVKVLEWEGDIVVPRKTTKSVFIPGAIVTVVLGAKDGGGNVTKACIRFRFRKTPWSSYIFHPYHYEGANETYPTSPLEKGRVVQIMAVDALNRMMDSAALKVAPPVGWDRSDAWFAQKGGPVIHPYAQWATPEGITVHSDVGGDPAAMSQIFSLAVNLYSELTGILPARLGAQTVSHTTAFSKDAEMSRGAARTVDFAKSSGYGPMTRWLNMCYQLGRAHMPRGKVAFFIPEYESWVGVNRAQLPEGCSFEWFGQAGPAEERARREAKVNSMQLALQLDQLNAETGGGELLMDVAQAIRSVLREGSWIDVDALMKAQAPGMMPESPPVPQEVEDEAAMGPAEAQGDSGVTAVALQGIQSAMRDSGLVQ